MISSDGDDGLRAAGERLSTIESKHDQGDFLPSPGGSAAVYDAPGQLLFGAGICEGQGMERGGRAEAPRFWLRWGTWSLWRGNFRATADVLMEVTALDAVHQAAEAWLRAQGDGSNRASIASITETHWKSRIFTVEPEPGFAFQFWAWTDPVKGKPVAVGRRSVGGGNEVCHRGGALERGDHGAAAGGALDALLRSGAQRADIEVVRVPGAWEIPAAARTVADLARQGKKRVDAIVTLGCLLRGETAHYEAIYNEVARGIGQSQQETGIPHSFGVLTCETLEQALNRAGIKAGNKGFEAAVAAIEMVSLRRKLAGKAASS